MKKYRITLSEEQLRLVANAVEDWHRFLAGQCELHHATSGLDNYRQVTDALMETVEPLIAPHGRGSSYGWNGGTCKNEHQRNAIAMSYGIYREILHYFAKDSKNDWDVYKGETLTCPEQGELIKIEEIKNDEE